MKHSDPSSVGCEYSTTPIAYTYTTCIQGYKNIANSPYTIVLLTNTISHNDNSTYIPYGYLILRGSNFRGFCGYLPSTENRS